MTAPLNTHSIIMPSFGVLQSEEGLVAGWNMFPENGKIIDQSSNNNNGTIIGGAVQEWTPLGTVISFDGVDDEINCGNDTSLDIESAITISCWFKAHNLSHAGSGNNARIADKSGSYVIVVTSAGILNFYTFGVSDQVSSTPASEILINKWYHLVCTFDSVIGTRRIYINGVLRIEETGLTGDIDVSTDFLLIGNNLANRFWKGQILEPKLYDVAKDQAWVTAEYNKGKKALFKTDYGVYESVSNWTNGGIENTPAVVSSGSFKISTDTIEGQVCKVIECVSSGVCYIPTSYFSQNKNESAYGEWEWYMMQNSSGSTVPRFHFIENGLPPSNGYHYKFNNDQSVAVVETGLATKFTTAVDTIIAGDWYKCSVIRDNASEFSCYLNNTLLVAVSGSNPFINSTTITSNYIAMDLDTGDKVAWSDIKGNHSIIKRLLP